MNERNTQIGRYLRQANPLVENGRGIPDTIRRITCIKYHMRML